MPFRSNSDDIAGADPRAEARLDGAIADFFLPDDARLDDRTRLALHATLQRLVGGIEADVRRHAGRLLAGRGQAEASAALLGAKDMALPLLADSGLLRDAALMEELIARTRAELMADALPIMGGEGNAPSLLVRLAELPDRVVAGAAQALLAAESRNAADRGLPAELHRRLTWWVTAAVRTLRPATVESDRALADAAQRCLAAHDENERPEAAADRLITAIDPLPGEIPALLIEALSDRRLNLVVALLARTLAIDGETVRALLIEPDDERLWAGLRAAGLARDEIARVALSLAEADPRRDIEVFADRLDDIAAVTPATAQAAIAPLSLPRDLRSAVRALANARR